MYIISSSVYFSTAQVMYFMAGLTAEVGRFFYFWVITLIIDM